MSAKSERRERPYSSQLIVEDSEAFVQRLKQRLAAKEGIPESQQRLIFSVPQSGEATDSVQAAHPPAEEVLGELGQWQAIVFQNGKAIGRLLSPQLSSTEIQEEGWTQVPQAAASIGTGVVVEIISIEYDQWQPAWLVNKSLSKPLYLPVDSTFAASTYRLQVVGRSGGRPFVVPFAYTFSGKQVSTSLSLEVQRAEYIRRHQVLRGGNRPEGSEHLRNLGIECGRGLEGFTAVFDAEDQPAWLKSVALRFAVVASGVLDDAAPPRCQHPMPADRPKAGALSEQQLPPEKQKQTQEQIAKESWLPKMVGPVSNSGRKGKAKQKGSKAQSHADKAKRVEAKGSGESEVDSPSTTSAASSAKDVPSGDEQLGNVRQESGSRETAEALPQAAVAAAQPEPQSSGRQADVELQGTKPSKAAAPVPDAQKQAPQMPAASRQPMGPTVTKAEVLTTPKQSAAKTAKSRLDMAETVAAPKGWHDLTVKSGQRIAVGRVGPQEGVRSNAPEGSSSTADRAVLHTRTHSGSPPSTSLGSKAAGGSGDGDAGSSEEDERDEKDTPDEQRGSGGGQGGDDGDHGRRWRPAQAGDSEQLREAEEAVPGEEGSPSDDSGSLATAVSDMNYSTSAAADNLQGSSSPGIPAVHAGPPESTGVSSSAGASFLTFSSFDSEKSASAGEEEPLLVDTVAPTGLPRLPNGVRFGHTEQPVAASRGQHPEVILVGRSKTAQSSPVKPRPAAISSSTSASNLLAQPMKQGTPAGSEVANGKLLARLQTAPQPMVREQEARQPRSARPLLVPSVNGPPAALTSELQRRNSRPYDPLSMVGSPISPKDFGGAGPWPSGDWGHSLPAVHPPTESGFLEENVERYSEAPGGAMADAPTSNGGLSYMLPLPHGMLPAALPNGFQQTGPAAMTSEPTRLRSRSQSEAGHFVAADAGHRQPAAAVKWTPNPASRPACVWSGADQGVALPSQASYPQPSLHRATDLPGKGPGLAPIASVPNGFGRPRPDSLAQLRQGEGLADPHLWSYDDLAFVPPLRPFSATSHRYEGGTATNKARSHDSAVDGVHSTLVAELQQARAAAAAGDRGRGRMGVMTPPPPPPPRTMTPQPELDPYENGIERQGSFQVPPPSYHSVFDQHGLPANDLERLMSCVTPVMELGGELAKGSEALRMLRLSDVWRFFEEASSYGREVYTRNGRRGPALAYYTPTLSAIRVLLPCASANREPESDGKTFAQSLVAHFESELPFNREPFADAVSRLSPLPSASSPEESWLDMRLCDLHPASWFAVAWYPVYRIPEAPLTAKFLTFHSLRPLPSSLTYFGAIDPADAAVNDSDLADSSPLCMPILGLKCAEQKSEQWLECYNHSVAARIEWEKRYQQLQARAERLSAGTHLRLLSSRGQWEQPRNSHSDLEWFNRHP